MRKSVRLIIEITAILASISGLTLSDLRSSNPILFYSALSLLIILSVVVFLAWGESNRFKDKSRIDQTWKKLLVGASRSILIFAGDVSWIERDEDIIHKRTEEGVKVLVLCRRPRNNQVLKDNLSKLINAGAEVKYYDENEAPIVRGLVVEKSNINISTALTVTKVARANVNRQFGVPGTEEIYSYEGIRYVPPSGSHYIQLLAQLFETKWKDSMFGMVLY